MPLNLEYFPTPGIAANDGVFIALTDLPGLTAAEIQPISIGRESRFVLSFLNQLYRKVQDIINKPLGLSISKASPVGAGADLINQNFNLTQVYDINLLNNIVDDIPTPTVGANAGFGEFRFDSAFPGSLNVLLAGTNTGFPGVLIPSSMILAYGGTFIGTYGGSPALNLDNRALFAAIMRMIVDNVTLRTPTTQESAVIAATKSNTTVFTPPAAFTTLPNPTSGLTSEQIKHHSFISVSYSITLQLKIDDFNQTYDVNVSEANQ